ncbi:hypothetical protein WAI453_001447 [Rhynchosporium graminicola]
MVRISTCGLALGAGSMKPTLLSVSGFNNSEYSSPCSCWYHRYRDGFMVSGSLNSYIHITLPLLVNASKLPLLTIEL